MAERPPPPPPLTKGEVAKEYLTAYNSICALLWLSVFGRVVVILPITGVESIYEAAGDFTKWTQTVAVLEILHSAFGTWLYTLLSPRATPVFGSISPEGVVLPGSTFTIMVGLTSQSRPRPLPPPYDDLASRLAHPPGLGRRQPIPGRDFHLPVLQQHAHRLVRNGGRSVQLLRPQPAGLRPGFHDVVAVQHVLRPVSGRYHERGCVGVESQ